MERTDHPASSKHFRVHCPFFIQRLQNPSLTASYTEALAVAGSTFIIPAVTDIAIIGRVKSQQILHILLFFAFHFEL
jgi:hypothetical protein